jgi:hypothetical protein
MNGDMPTVAGFLIFIRNQMGIAAQILPDSDPGITVAYNVACEIVNRAIAKVSCQIYALAVYNLAAANLIEFAQDQPNAAPIAQSDPPLPYFAYYRNLWKINSFVSGVVAAAGDDSTSNSMVTMEAFKTLTMADLQYLKTPWGRQYLSFAQRYGGIVGVS